MVVKIAENASFATTGYTPQIFTVDIPPGKYGRAILNVSMRLTDRQYDRIFWIFANGIPIYWGSTVQRLNSTAEADVTLFLNLFKGRVNFSIVLPNWVVPNLVPGVFLVNVTLYLYPGETPAWGSYRLYSSLEGSIRRLSGRVYSIKNYFRNLSISTIRCL